MDESEAARLANIESYATRDAEHGSPHLNHRSVRAIYELMVRKALGSVQAHPRVLDLGAGDGAASTPWVEASARLTAVDSSAEQLRRLKERLPEAVVVECDAMEFLSRQHERFDVVSHVSMLHHIPDYLALLKASIQGVRPGGALLTFQDPLNYDQLPRAHYLAAQALYIPWRLSQGDIVSGIGNRVRRSRGIYLADNQSDQEEYHVKRKGMDSDAMHRLLSEHFANVEIEVYFSTQTRLGQWIGERLRLRSAFGLVATEKR